jgi:hypothetical protein
MFAWYRELLRLRKLPSLATATERTSRAIADEKKKVLVLVRAPRNGTNGGPIAALFNYSDVAAQVEVPSGVSGWHVLLSSEDPRFGDTGGTQLPDALRPGTTITLPATSMLVLEPA